MKKISSVVIFYLFILGIVFLGPIITAINESGHNPFDYARITDVEYKAVVVDEPGEGGKIIVTERLTFDIHAASQDNPFWELWRDLPEAYVDGVKVEYKVNSVKQILANGQEIIYEESPVLYWEDEDYVNTAYGLGPRKWYHSEGPYNEDLAQYECVFFYIDGVYREEMVFEIEYEMENAALRYNDSSELYLTFYDGSTIRHLNSFKGQILIPDKDMPSAGNYEAHTYGTNSHEFDFTESSTINPGYHTFMIELDKSQLKFKSYNQYIEFTLVSFGDDKHKFTEYAPNNLYSDEDVLHELREEQTIYEELPEKYRKRKLFVLLVSAFVALATVWYTFHTDKRMRKKHVFYHPQKKIDYYRNIPSNLDPTFAAALVFCKEKAPKDIEDGYSALLLSLIRKGYIELERIEPQSDWNFYNVKIVVKYRPPTLIQNVIQTTQTPIISGPTILPGQSVISKQVTPLGQTIVTTQHPTLVHQPTQPQAVQPIGPIKSMFTSHTQPAINTQPVISETTQAQELFSQENKDLEPLTLTEEYYFNLIIRHSKRLEITMASFQDRISSDYEYTNSFVRNMDKSTTNIGISQGYFQKINYQMPKQSVQSLAKFFKTMGFIIIILANLFAIQTRLDLAFGAFFLLGIALIVSASHLKKISKNYVLLTQFGEDEYAKWRGLYNYLNGDTLIKDSTVIDLETWEQYLIYATAFGLSEKVIAAINVKCPHIDTSKILSNQYYRSPTFYHSNRSFRTTAHRTSYSSLSGGHGGYGGGGRGGGGGGGGH